MTNDIFLDKLEATYGQYKQGMKAAILAETRAVESSSLNDLFIALTKEYERHSPPPLPTITGIAQRLGLSMHPRGMEFVSVCGGCHQEFPLEMYDCPHCGKGDASRIDKTQNPVPNRDRSIRRKA